MNTCIVETINKEQKNYREQKREPLEVDALAALPDVTLSEAGFSEPVGIFDPIKRIAYLTTSLVNRSLIIEVSDALFLGKGFTVSQLTFKIAVQIASEVKNLVIRDLTIDSVGTSMFIEGQSENIKIQNCRFLGFGYGIGMSDSRKILIEQCKFENLFGISLNVTTCVQITHNEFINNLNAVNLYDSAQKTLIAENKFINCSEGVLFFQNNTRNVVFNNKFIVEKALIDARAIILFTNNSFNTIKNNSMILENVDYILTDDIIKLGIYFVYVDGEENSLNKFIDNKFKINQNKFNLSATTSIEVKIYGVGFYFANTKNEISNNEFEIEENLFSMQGGESQVVILENILSRESLNNKITDNKCIICKNQISYDSSVTTIYTENIYVGTEDKGSYIKENKCLIIENKIILNELVASPLYYANNLIMSSAGSGNIICNNELRLKENWVFGELVSIRLEDACTCNEILNNNLKDIEGYGIYINTGGVNNVIDNNILENISQFAIAIVSDNFSNIISNNNITGYYLGIYAGFDNTSNVIDNNTIKNTKYGIYFALDGNSSNTVKNNKLCNILLTLFGIDPVENYLCDNVITCCEEKKQTDDCSKCLS